MPKGLMLHCGAEKVVFDELGVTPLPERTSTYSPLGHQDFATNVKEISDKMLLPEGYVFVDDAYGLGKDGQKMFGLLKYQREGDLLGKTVGMRNSYDKSMAAGICLGANVFVCDNLMFNGDITVMRKHTGDVGDHLVRELLGAFFNSTATFNAAQECMNHWMGQGISDREAFELLGYLMGLGIIQPTMANIAFGDWKNPRHDEFKPKNVWSLYNCITEGLKKVQPQKIFEKHTGVHKVFEAEWRIPSIEQENPFD